VASALVVSLAAYVPVVASGHISRDSGVFLYTGMAVSRGGMPYVDSWDHKGPLLAALEAVAWRLGGGVLGAPLLEALALFVGLAVAGVLWARWIGGWASVAVVVLGLSYLAVFEGGNFTETWLFPVQLVAYSLAAHTALMYGRDAPARVSVLLGSVTGLALSVALFTRVNNAAGLLALAVVGVVVLRRRLLFGATVLGVVAVIGGALTLWLLAGHAFRAAIDQYVRYNLFYAGGATVGERIDGFAALTQLLLSSSIVLAALGVLGAWLVGVLRSESLPRGEVFTVVLFVGVGVIDTLSEVASGRPYPHYLIVALPGIAVTAVIASARVVSAARGVRTPGARRLRLVAIVVAFAVTVAGSGATAAQGVRWISESGVFVAGSYQAQIVDRVEAETNPYDRVLVHGAETWILAASGRFSPTSITYSLPVEQGYGGLAAQYRAEIEAVPPALIVESPIACGISTACAPSSAHFEGLAPWVAASYDLEGDIAGFRFWRRHG
jgi:hypothetical protein